MQRCHIYDTLASASFNIKILTQRKIDILLFMYYFNNMKTYIIAIDPGKNGGIIATYNNKVVDISNMPAGPTELYEHFIYLGLPNSYKGNLRIIIENVHSMPTDGSKAAFTFGKGLGWIEGVIAAMGLLGCLERILPSVWMKYFGIVRIKGETKTSFKNRLKQKAIEIHKNPLTLKTCDAYLIAIYAQQNQNKE